MPSPITNSSKRFHKRKILGNGPRTIMLHWQVGEGEEEWQASQQVFTADVVNDIDPPRLRRWWPVLLALTLVGVLGSVVWVQGQIGLTKIEAELQATLDGESWLTKQSSDQKRAAQQGDLQAHAADLAAQVHDLGKTNEVITEMEIVELEGNWARVLVIERTTQNASAYRQTRLYQYTAAGWQRIPPTSNHWGKAQQLESRYFIFHYFAQDADAVEAAAARLDALYTVFFAALLPGSLPAQKVQVEIVPSPPGGQGGYMSAYKLPLVVISPAAILAPAEVTEDELLLQSVALALFDYLAVSAVEVLDLPAEWFAVSSALHLWLIWDQELPLARWRKPLVQWVFSNAQVSDLAQGRSGELFVNDLCAYYQLWMITPADFGIPVICYEHRGAGEKDHWANTSDQPTLENLAQPTSAVALATLFEYLSATYGDDKMRATAELLSVHQTWASLIPTVFGVSEEVVEAGWRAFIAEQYYGIREQ